MNRYIFVVTYPHRGGDFNAWADEVEARTVAGGAGRVARIILHDDPVASAAQKLRYSGSWDRGERVVGTGEFGDLVVALDHAASQDVDSRFNGILGELGELNNLINEVRGCPTKQGVGRVLQKAATLAHTGWVSSRQEA
jgi:hypothetical protein